VYVANGKFWNYIGPDGKGYWWYDLRGARLSLVCQKLHPGSRSCKRFFRWH
jgi:hypothetical protein